MGPEAAGEGRQGSLVGSLPLNPCSMKPRRSRLSGDMQGRKWSLSSHYSGDDAHGHSSPQGVEAFSRRVELEAQRRSCAGDQLLRSIMGLPWVSYSWASPSFSQTAQVFGALELCTAWFPLLPSCFLLPPGPHAEAAPHAQFPHTYAEAQPQKGSRTEPSPGL